MAVLERNKSLREQITWPPTMEERDRLIHERVMLQSLLCPETPIVEQHTIPSRLSGSIFVAKNNYSYNLWHCPLCHASGYDQPPEEHEQPGALPPYTSDLEIAMQLWREVVIAWPSRLPDLDVKGRFAQALGGISLLASIDVEQVASLTAEQIALAALSAIGLEVIT